jgi:hypothetical protein
MPRGPVRARDLRANIREAGFENGVVATIEHLLEEFAQYRQHMREMTDLLATCVDQVGLMVDAGQAMTKRLDQIKRDQTKGDEISHGETNQ